MTGLVTDFVWDMLRTHRDVLVEFLDDDQDSASSGKVRARVELSQVNSEIANYCATGAGWGVPEDEFKRARNDIIVWASTSAKYLIWHGTPGMTELQRADIQLRIVLDMAGSALAQIGSFAGLNAMAVATGWLQDALPEAAEYHLPEESAVLRQEARLLASRSAGTA